eukprot:964043-Pelagomonas_calceolata.AAC.1
MGSCQWEFLERLAAAATERGPIGRQAGHGQTLNTAAPTQSNYSQQEGQQQQEGRQQQQQQEGRQQQQQKKALPFQDVAISVWSEYAFTVANGQQQQQQQQQQQKQQQQGEPPSCMIDEDLGALRLHDGLSAEQ